MVNKNKTIGEILKDSHNIEGEYVIRAGGRGNIERTREFIRIRNRDIYGLDGTERPIIPPREE